MGKVITVMNMKGGVGKTTVATHLAGIIPRLHGKTLKVLVIDYDPQFNLSQALLSPKTYFSIEKDKKTILSVLVDDDVDLNPYQIQVSGNIDPPDISKIVHNVVKFPDGSMLDILPSTLDLMYIALGRSDVQIKPMEERFRKFINECRSFYDIVIIDCHPAGSLFTKTSINNSDHVVIPVIPQRYAVRGIGLMMRFLSAKSTGSKGPEPHILFNHASRVGVSEQETEIRSDKDFASFCMQNTLKRYKIFSEPEGGIGFVWSSSKPYSTEAYLNLARVARELLQRIGA